MIVTALVVVSILLAICLGIIFFGPNNGEKLEKALAQLQAAKTERQQAEAEAERKRKEQEELRAQMADLKEQLRQSKKKLHDQRESEKDGKDLQKARTDVERQASMQLESVRAELAGALTEIERLKSQAQSPRERRPVSPTEATVIAPAPLEKTQVVRTIRELSPAEKEKMDRLEHQANRDRAKAAEVEKELRRVKGRLETQNRIYVVTKGELDLLKDKFRALEKRLNRTLLERDLTKRAIVALEKKTGLTAERTELTADEVAASDAQVEAAAKAEDTARQEAQQRAQAAAASQGASEEPVPNGTHAGS